MSVSITEQAHNLVLNRDGYAREERVEPLESDEPLPQHLTDRERHAAPGLDVQLLDVHFKRDQIS